MWWGPDLRSVSTYPSTQQGARVPSPLGWAPGLTRKAHPPKSALRKAWCSVLEPETTTLTTDTSRWSRLGSRKAPKVSLHGPHSI